MDALQRRKVRSASSSAGKSLLGSPSRALQSLRSGFSAGVLLRPAAFVLVVLVAAAFFRLWRLSTIPPGLFGDEATDGLDALDVLAGRGAVFFPANYGREGLHVWIVAAAFRLLGIAPLALRLPSVIAGILTVLATYWLGVELLRSVEGSSPGPEPKACASGPWRYLPLVAALYLATSYFHVHFSRFGIRGVFTPLCGAAAFAAFWRGANGRQRHLWYALSGLFLGLGLHFYTASRFYPFFLAGFLVLDALVCLARRRPRSALLIRDFGPLFLLFLVAALVFAPLGLYFWQHPGSFTQRAAEVSAFTSAAPGSRVVQAALANVLQFFLPGGGDQAQFYNLPGRAVFDPLTALLALAGLGVLIRYLQQRAALFLLTWFPVMVLPSFLATDRFPTLPRVLGTIPGIYFFPAVGLLSILALLRAWLLRSPAPVGPEPAAARAAAGSPVLPALAALAGVALLAHASTTYRDYFLTWGRSPETLDAFEVDMVQAAGWLAAHQPASHVYLSSDIYRHPTFMLLHEHAAVTEYFQHADPRLSWFDARSALPLAPAGQPAVYLLPESSRPAPPAAALLAGEGKRLDPPPSRGQPSLLAALELPGNTARPAPGGQPAAFSPHLKLLDAAWIGEPPRPALRLYWETAGADPEGWPGYRLQVTGHSPDGADWQQEVPFDDFRPPEWVAGGRFLTWRELRLPPGVQQLPAALRLRLVTADTGQPLVAPGAPDGWHEVAVSRAGP